MADATATAAAMAGARAAKKHKKTSNSLQLTTTKAPYARAKAHYGICFAVVSGNAIKFQKFEFLDAVSHGKGERGTQRLDPSPGSRSMCNTYWNRHLQIMTRCDDTSPGPP